MSAHSPARLLWFVAGFGIWSSALIVIYALHAFGCAYRWPDGTMRFVVGAMLALHLAAIVLLIRRVPRDGTLISAAQWTLIAALAATVATFGPLPFLTPCV